MIRMRRVHLLVQGKRQFQHARTDGLELCLGRTENLNWTTFGLERSTEFAPIQVAPKPPVRLLALAQIVLKKTLKTAQRFDGGLRRAIVVRTHIRRYRDWNHSFQQVQVALVFLDGDLGPDLGGTG